MQETEKKNYLAMWDGSLGADRNPTNFQRRDDGSHIFHNEVEYYEWWYFDISLTNDYHVVITYHYRNIFLKPMIPSIQIFIYKPDGKKIERFDLVAPENASASPDYCDVRMGDSWVKDTGSGYELYMKIKDVSAPLTFESQVPPWKPGRGFNYKNEAAGRVAGWVVPVPHANVSGTLVIGDEKMSVEGAGYHDHNWGNFHCHQTFRAWYWGRIHHERYALDYGWVLPREEGNPVVAPLLIARENEIVLSTNMLSVELLDEQTEEKLGQKYARRLLLKADAKGVQLNMDIRTHRIIDTVMLPKVTDWNHYYYRFLADYTMEIVIDGKSEKMQGEMLHELMLL